MTAEKKKTLILCAILVLCLIVLALLSILVVKNIMPTENVPEAQYVELSISESMGLETAKAKLDELGIAYEIIPTNSRTANRVEKIEYLGKEEDGKRLCEVGSTVKIHANEVGIDKVVYLTFDDGPTRDNTTDILATLQKHGIKASFFVEGQDVALYPDRMVATVEGGHLIACHSYSHKYESVYASVDSFLSEIELYENAMINALGEETFNSLPKILRFPGGTNNNYLTNSESLQYILAVRGAGYAVYDWTALTGDADGSGNNNAEYFISSLSKSLEKSKNEGLPLIVLMHDKWSTNEALDEIISFLVSEGYYFDTVDNCPEYTFVE